MFHALPAYVVTDDPLPDQFVHYFLQRLSIFFKSLTVWMRFAWSLPAVLCWRKGRCGYQAHVYEASPASALGLA